ncbi:hypothetical protein ASPBRDRAFT_438536 [Aspergillus brasiliensis CBS 101740]|uniref:Uncharacterized protein n=1 Tax=Aspergillus brasiliensis (strain CBS 101740 / IMI 381727 / IBT 21946) TaxID=767769 RepID=A0A1L9URG7_ASPBC|nr:hypothetical protein ASPBRDRAFT_438536 [Aspergillus brasiliensis CBS 101740]
MAPPRHSPTLHRAGNLDNAKGVSLFLLEKAFKCIILLHMTLRVIDRQQVPRDSGPQPSTQKAPGGSPALGGPTHGTSHFRMHRASSISLVIVCFCQAICILEMTHGMWTGFLSLYNIPDARCHLSTAPWHSRLFLLSGYLGTATTGKWQQGTSFGSDKSNGIHVH